MRKEIKAAFFYTLDFQLRALKPIAENFNGSLISKNLDEIKEYNPDFVFTADYSCKALSECFKHEKIFIMAVRHGAVNKYSEPEDDFSYADFVFGTEYEKKYLESGNIKPRMEFIITGNPWVDETFRIPKKKLNYKSPTILFAPTYNPEISAAAVPGNKLYEIISKIFSDFRLIIKPHPAVISRVFEHLIKYEQIFDEWLNYWKSLDSKYDNVKLILDPSAPISDFFIDADILISDKSSLIWEYIILERPILLYQSEALPELWSKYKTELSIDNKTDVGPRYKDENQFAELLIEIFTLHQNYYAEKQNLYKNEIFGNYQDGISAIRISEAIYKIYEEKISNRIIEEAEILIQDSQIESAKNLLQKALKYNKFKIDALNDLAYIEILNENYKQALDHISDVLSLNPNDEIALNNLNYLMENNLLDSNQIKNSILKKIKTSLQLNEIHSFENFTDYQRRMRNELNSRIEFENKLTPLDSDEFHYNAFCIVCNDLVPLKVDFWNSYLNNGKKIPNWRESLVCPSCNLNNRMRLTYHLIQEVFPNFINSQVYITEQTTPLFQILKNLIPAIVGSEFLGKNIPRGNLNHLGIRNEDLTNLSFHNEQFDFIISLEVLEHIPDYITALKEVYRVLKQNGKFLFTVPFDRNSKENIVRAKLNSDGSITHLLPTEYHGDPMNFTQGCLCYYYFGWELLNEIKDIGFTNAYAITTYSKEYGYLGGEQIFFVAVKGE